MTTDDSSANGYLARLRGQQRDQTILTLHQQEHSIREIAHLLKVSRNTVRRIIRNPPQFYEEVDKEGGAEHASLGRKKPTIPLVSISLTSTSQPKATECGSWSWHKSSMVLRSATPP